MRHWEFIQEQDRPCSLFSLDPGSLHRLVLLSTTLFTPCLLLAGYLHLLDLRLEIPSSRKPSLDLPPLLGLVFPLGSLSSLG